VQKNRQRFICTVEKIETWMVLGGSFALLTEDLKGNNHRVAGTYKQLMHDECTDVVKFFKMPSR